MFVFFSFISTYLHCFLAGDGKKDKKEDIDEKNGDWKKVESEQTKYIFVLKCF